MKEFLADILTGFELFIFIFIVDVFWTLAGLEQKRDWLCCEVLALLFAAGATIEVGFASAL